MGGVSDGANIPKKVRRDPRIVGPFQGRRIGGGRGGDRTGPVPASFDVDFIIHDLSITGCLIESLDDVPVGTRMTIEIDLVSEGTVRLDAESVYARPDIGLAVKFVQMSPQVRVQLARMVVHRLKERGGQ